MLQDAKPISSRPGESVREEYLAALPWSTVLPGASRRWGSHVEQAASLLNLGKLVSVHDSAAQARCVSEGRAATLAYASGLCCGIPHAHTAAWPPAHNNPLAVASRYWLISG